MDSNHDILVELEKIKGQLDRLVADAESEKDTRKRRNENIDKRIKDLEDDKIKRDTTIIVIKALILGLAAIVGFIITKLLK